MNRAQRAELLRRRFKANGAFAYVPSGKPAKIYIQWPEANRDTARAGVWMHPADPRPKVIPRTKNRKGVPALTMIAAKAPKKLVRACRTADVLVAARKNKQIYYLPFRLSADAFA
jgi:hypothetical protein